MLFCIWDCNLVMNNPNKCVAQYLKVFLGGDVLSLRLGGQTVLLNTWSHQWQPSNSFYVQLVCVFLSWSVCVRRRMTKQRAACHRELLTDRQQCLYALALQPVRPVRRQTHTHTVDLLYLTRFYLRHLLIIDLPQKSRNSINYTQNTQCTGAHKHFTF